MGRVPDYYTAKDFHVNRFSVGSRALNAREILPLPVLPGEIAPPPRLAGDFPFAHVLSGDLPPQRGYLARRAVAVIPQHACLTDDAVAGRQVCDRVVALSIANGM